MSATKMLTVSLLFCALIALGRAEDNSTKPDDVPAMPEDNSTKSDDVPAMPDASVAATEEEVVATAAAPPTPPAPSCPEGWSEHSGHCYHFVPREMTWADAEKNCLTMTGNLASVHSVEEYHFIQDIIKRQTQAHPETWIGGSNCQQENSWLWTDGTHFSYQFWCAGQPDNQYANQGCLQMNHDDDNCWDDTACNLPRPSVCSTAL